VHRLSQHRQGGGAGRRRDGEIGESPWARTKPDTSASRSGARRTRAS
jgi:hypothetical protein